jgi:hypothetical protein
MTKGTAILSLAGPVPVALHGATKPAAIGVTNPTKFRARIQGGRGQPLLCLVSRQVRRAAKLGWIVVARRVVVVNARRRRCVGPARNGVARKSLARTKDGMMSSAGWTRGELLRRDRRRGCRGDQRAGLFQQFEQLIEFFRRQAVAKRLLGRHRQLVHFLHQLFALRGEE